MRCRRGLSHPSGDAADVPADVDSTAAPPRDDTLRAEISALKQNVSELRDEIESLKAAISRLNRHA